MATDETVPLVLRKLGNLWKLDVTPLRWNTLTVELRQSLRWLLQLPSITMLQIAMGHFISFDDFFNFVSLARDLTNLTLTEIGTTCMHGRGAFDSRRNGRWTNARLE
ncbi:hypothetical protein JB92DRAFT_2894038 [Gautieria morchelliformis]|nr:hypothetical protein JB92DRAFT_2894038 [Gautieria morchelliformis]